MGKKKYQLTPMDNVVAMRRLGVVLGPEGLSQPVETVEGVEHVDSAPG